MLPRDGKARRASLAVKHERVKNIPARNLSNHWSESRAYQTTADAMLIKHTYASNEPVEVHNLLLWEIEAGRLSV